MRYTHFLTLAVLGVAAGSAEAQDSPRTSSGSVRISGTAPRAISWSSDNEHRAALGVSTTTTGTSRDTLGIMISAVTKNSPAERAGLEEGNRIVSINGVNLRADIADVEDNEMSSALTRRLVRELGKVKAGDEVDLRVYREGKLQNIKVKTVDSDELFGRAELVRSMSKEDRDNRPALGISVSSNGSRRDTLGVLVMSVGDSTSAAKAGLEEGNRIAAINGVSLRVAHEDAGDRSMSSIKAQRLNREIAKLKPGENVTLSVYSNGRFRDVTVKVMRAGDLPKSSGFNYFSGDGFAGFTPFPAMPAMPAMPSMRALEVMPAMPAMPVLPRVNEGTYIYTPRMRENLDGVRARLEEIRPALENLDGVRVRLNEMRPNIERAFQRVRMLSVTV